MIEIRIGARLSLTLLVLQLPTVRSYGTEASSNAWTPQSAALAAQKTASTHPKCLEIAPFYWEIGDRDQILASGSIEGKRARDSVRRATEFGIASASKWIFAAYVLEKQKGKIDPETKQFLTMSSGYDHLKTLSCVFSSTVKGCFDRRENSKFSKEDKGIFFYNGGHFQKWGIDHGMADMTKEDLSKEYQSQLGKDLPLEFGGTQLAGGIKTSAQTYALFLQKVLKGNLRIKEFLGKDAICTLPASCASSRSSPIPLDWHYSYGHWVEDDSEKGDGSFSSAGLFGFYPWIDHNKKFYGLISRHKTPSLGDEIGSGLGSAQCGGLIRKSFLLAQPQL